VISSELDHLIAAGTILASEVAAIIGKTEGNGGVNDFTRGYFYPDADGAAVATPGAARISADSRDTLRAVGRDRRGDEPALQSVLHQ